MAIKISKKGPPASVEPAEAPAPPPKPAKGASEADKVLAGFRKAHGDQTALMGGQYAPVGRLASGIFPLDLAIGGGFPDHRISMVFGPESSGKTAVGLRLLAAVQRRGQRGVLIDKEHVYDKKWTALFGVNVDDLIVVQPDNGEQAVEACEGFMNADDVGLVVLDSLANIQPQKWIDQEVGKAPVGGNTQLVSQLYTKVGTALSKAKKRDHAVQFFVINQIRYKIGQMFGDPETTPGGKQPQFASSLSVRFWGKKIKPESANMATHIHVDGIVRKWRVPIISSVFEYDMALTPFDGNKVGEVIDTWKTVGTRLQDGGELRKGGKGWLLLDAETKTLDEMKTKYRTETEFQLACQKKTIELAEKIDSQK